MKERLGRSGGLLLLVHAYEALLVLLLGIIAALIATAVFFRYVLGEPILYSYELSSLLFVWLVFLSLPAGAARAAHLGADILTPYLGEKLLLVLQAVAHVLSIAVLGYIAWYAYVLAGRTRVEMPTIGISMAWMYAAVPVGCGLYIGWILWDLAHMATAPRRQLAEV
ncbi:TRAP transporter small permease [Microvirga vignae]|uniref:TRAP transporter small permease n=1 Tax=Microvirga vignae TaxID=1225564 RepID=UPI00069BA48A|nr:TRAP transporter small permease [Microvirga vignae]